MSQHALYLQIHTDKTVTPWCRCGCGWHGDRVRITATRKAVRAFRRMSGDAGRDMEAGSGPPPPLPDLHQDVRMLPHACTVAFDPSRGTFTAECACGFRSGPQVTLPLAFRYHRAHEEAATMAETAPERS